VWSETVPAVTGVEIHREMGSFGPADLCRVGRKLDAFPAPRNIILQWVPHGFGYRSLNLAFCFWLWIRGTFCRDRLNVMVHEPFLTFREGNWRQDAAAVVHRIMIVLVLDAAHQVWVSIPAWIPRLKKYALRRDFSFEWLPIPTTIPPVDDSEGTARVRAQYLPQDGLLLGHFGTFGQRIAPLLEACIPTLLEGRPERAILLMGRASESFRETLIARHPDLAEQVWATGSLLAAELSVQIRACDLMIQPYEDGISTRRTSAMAALSHGLPLVTTGGHNTETFWTRNNAIALVPCGDTCAFVKVTEQLLNAPEERRRMGLAARKLYVERFDLHNALAAIRQAAA
jgi:hypothetical protein